MKLYEITEQFKELEKLTDSELPENALQDTFEALQGDFESKSIALITVAKNIESNTAEIDAEIERLKARKQSMLKTIDRMKEYLRFNMEATGIKKIECPIFTVSHRNGRDIVQIDDEDMIPDEYMVVPDPVIKPDKKRLLHDLKEGQEIPGVHIAKSKASILIK